MPNARTHDLLTIASGALLGPATYSYLTGPMQFDHPAAVVGTLWLVGSHIVSGIMFSPDLDIDSAIDDRWGIFHWIWEPYERAVPHRHFWSHSLVFAPLLRLAYFFAVVMGLLFAWVWVLARLGVVVPDYHWQLYDALRAWLNANPGVRFAILLGFITGSAVHTIADWSVTNGRRFLSMFGVRIVRDYRDHDDYIHRRRRRRYA
jgi:uncharacterized metal-binding protein